MFSVNLRTHFSYYISDSMGSQSSKFFREMDVYMGSSRDVDFEDDFKIALLEERIRNETKALNSKEQSHQSYVLEEDQEQIEYVRKLETDPLFRESRDSLPQYFIDRRVELKMTVTMGRGCFARDFIPKNTLIESAPVILVHRDTFKELNIYNGDTHKLSEYPFSWGRDGLCALALGWGGLYNHQPFPNAVWRPNYDIESMQYTTCKDIEAGEEIFIRYLPLNRLDNLWFPCSASEEAAKTYRAKSEDPINPMTWAAFNGAK